MSQQSTRSGHWGGTDGGSVLVPVLIVAIIIVLVLMWQSGMFGGTSSGSATASSSSANPGEAVAGSPAEPQPAAAQPETETPALPDRPLTENERNAMRARNYQPSPERLAAESGGGAAMANTAINGVSAAEAAAIDGAAAQLIANNQPDFSACRGAADANQVLECAATEQTRVLQAAFAEHNEQRTAGDEISVEHGGAIMKQVIDALQSALEPFVQAADNS